VGAAGIQQDAGTAKGKLEWSDIVKHNLKNMDITWELEAKELAADRKEWCQRVNQCIQ